MSVIIENLKEEKRRKNLAKEIFSVDMKDNMAQAKVKDKNIKEVSEVCLEGLSLIMKEYGSVSMESCFSGCSKLTTLNFPSTFNTSSVTDMSSMFHGCSSLSSLDLSTFNTSNVTDMSWMFNGCSSLSSLDLSTFNTSNVINMHGMFQYCSGLSSVKLSTFNTSIVTDMICMFAVCNSLTSLDLSTFNTSSVRDMHGMFYECRSLSSFNLSRFNTSSVKPNGSFRGCINMFDGCSKLKELYVKDERIKSSIPSGVSVKTK